MTCNKCKSEWTTPPRIIVTVCPFCKADVTKQIIKTYDVAKDALRYIFVTYGAEALLEENLFLDIAPSLKIPTSSARHSERNRIKVV